MIRVELPSPLRRLVSLEGREVTLAVNGETQGQLIDALEERFPTLRGTVRDLSTGERRAYLRFFACQQDISHEGLKARLPDAVLRGEEPLLIVGAVAGG